MSIFNVSTRYSKALFEQAESKGNLNAVAADVEFVHNTIEGSKELRNLLKSPVIGEDRKLSALEEIFKNKTSQDIINFLKFIVSKGRADLLNEVLKRFLEIYDENAGIVNISVSSSEKMNELQAKKLENNLESFTNKKVKVKYSVDDGLIGGFIAKIGDTLIDASVANQLRLLKKQLLR